jgi:hypothetical protein
LIRIFSLKTCAAHITHEGHLAALFIDAHGAAFQLTNPLHIIPQDASG